MYDFIKLAEESELINDYKSAINYYELALKESEDYKIYGNLARLYADVYKFNEKDKQFYYSKKAFELGNDDISLINFTFVCVKFNYLELADLLFEEIKRRNINIPSIIFLKGVSFIKRGDFNGYRQFRARFEHDPNILPINLDKTKLWKEGQDLSDKTVLICFEQGFGDVFMFIRFVQDVIPLCKRLIIVVQNELYDLIKSNFDFEIYSADDLDNIKYDVFIPIMDLIVLLNIKSDNIPYKDGYLKIENDKYFFTDKFKVGICLKSVQDSVHPERTVPIEYLSFLFDIYDIEIYNFQKEEISTKDYPVIQLGKTFKNFSDTAKALKSMDLVITSDNVILNLAGALGVKTFALLNLYCDCRWFKFEEDIGWYSSVKPFQCEEFAMWEKPVNKLKDDVLNILKSKV